MTRDGERQSASILYWSEKKLFCSLPIAITNFLLDRHIFYQSWPKVKDWCFFYIDCVVNVSLTANKIMIHLKHSGNALYNVTPIFVA